MRYISQLPEPYKSLAEKRREQDDKRGYSDNIEIDFYWAETLEGHRFWQRVFESKTEQELPPIPEAE